MAISETIVIPNVWTRLSNLLSEAMDPSKAYVLSANSAIRISNYKKSGTPSNDHFGTFIEHGTPAVYKENDGVLFVRGVSSSVSLSVEEA